MKSTYTRANPPLARILLGGCALGVSIGSNAADLSAQILDGLGRSLAGVDAKLYELVSVAQGEVKETRLGVARSGIDGKVTIRYADPHARGATSQHLDEIRPALLAAVSDAHVGHSASELLSQTAVPNDMAQIVRSAPTASTTFFENRWLYSVVTALIEPTTLGGNGISSEYGSLEIFSVGRRRSYRCRRQMTPRAYRVSCR